MLEHVSHKTCVDFFNTSMCVESTQVCVFHYDKSIVFWRTQTCVWPTQVFLECTSYTGKSHIWKSLNVYELRIYHMFDMICLFVIEGLVLNGHIPTLITLFTSVIRGGVCESARRGEANERR